jgi:hypothetical protein
MCAATKSAHTNVMVVLLLLFFINDKEIVASQPIHTTASMKEIQQP